MTSLSKAWETKALKWLKGTEAPSVPTTWVALSTTAPTRIANGTEAAYTGYKRIKVEATKWTITEGNESTAGYFVNSEEVKFPECTLGESKVKWVEIFTAETAGEQIAWGELTEEKTINITNTPPAFAAGELKLSVS